MTSRLPAYPRIPPRFVRPGLFNVVAPGERHPSGQRGIDRSNDPARHSHHERSGWHLHPFRNDGPGGYHAAAADADSVEQDATHGDQAFILDRAAVENDPVPHTYAPPYRTGHPLIHVDDGAILDIRLCTNDDRRHVTPKDGAVPDTGVFSQRDVPHYGGGGRNECRRMNFCHCARRRVEAATIGYKTVARGGTLLLGGGPEQHLSPGLDRRAVLERGVPRDGPHKVTDLALVRGIV
jgi:hypothetical protein